MFDVVIVIVVITTKRRRILMIIVIVVVVERSLSLRVEHFQRLLNGFGKFRAIHRTKVEGILIALTAYLTILCVCYLVFAVVFVVSAAAAAAFATVCAAKIN